MPECFLFFISSGVCNAVTQYVMRLQLQKKCVNIANQKLLSENEKNSNYGREEQKLLYTCTCPAAWFSYTCIQNYTHIP